MKVLFLFLSVVFLFSCKKDDVPSASLNYSLLNKTRDEIRSAVAGTWQVQREIQLTVWDGGSATDQKTWLPNTGHIVKFLSNDTLNMFKSDMTQVYVYDKADFARIANPITNNTTDSVYSYNIPNGNKWVIREIKNDTLVFYDVYPEHITVTYFATRKN